MTMPPSERKDVNANPSNPPEEGNRSRANIVALVFIVALLAAAFWVFKLLQQSNDIQNCIASGRRDCIDLARPDGRKP